MLRWLALFGVFLFTPSVLAQGAFNLMELSAAPGVLALGEAGVAAPSAEPQAFLYNPAHLAAAARVSHVTLSGYAPTTWFALDLNTIALSGGLAPAQTGWPVYLGAGVSYTRQADAVPLEYRSGTNELLGSVTGFQRAWSFGVGVGYVGPVEVHLGTALRRLSAGFDIDSGDFGELEDATSSTTTLDIGALTRIPIGQLAGWRLPGTATGLALDVSLGYALSGLGGRSPSGAGLTPEGPLSRRVRLGWSAQVGYDVDFGGGPVRLVELVGVAQADRGLLRDRVAEEYAAPFVNPLAALTGSGKTSESGEQGQLLLAEGYTGRRGVEFTVVETLTLRVGQHQGEQGFLCDDNRSQVGACETFGVELSAGGALRALGSVQDRPRWHALGHRFDLRYAFTSHPIADAFHVLTLRVQPFVVVP